MAILREAIIPDHVPGHLVRDLDYEKYLQGMDESWSSLRDAPDIFWSPHHGGHWVLTTHADMTTVLSTPADFSSRTQAVPRTDKPILLPPLEYDPPVHTEFRRLLNPYFAPKAMADLQSKAHDITVDLIDRHIGRGGCEFVADCALVMPIGIFMSLVDLPECDRLFLIGCAEHMVRGTPEEKTAAYERVFRYLGAKFAERRANPGTDILSALTQAEVEGGRRLTETELLGMGALLLGGGLDTVASTMGFIMVHLARNDADRRRLVEQPELINSALEELMRRYQIAALGREVTRDVTISGVEMKAGDVVLVPTPMAGLDETEYPDANIVDFARLKKRSLIFGAGPHQCVGQFLARTELRVFLSEWLKRIPDFRISDGEEPVIVGGPANSVQYLPLAWDVPGA